MRSSVLGRRIAGEREPDGIIRRHAGRLRRSVALAGAAAALLGAICLGPPPARGDIVYLYDDLGRLSRVIREDGEAATYHYDAVGNILRITRESGVSQTTTVDAQSVTSGGQGATVPLTLTGTNLIGASVVCTTPGVSVRNLRSDLDGITFDLSLAPTTALGPVRCEVRGLTVVPLAFTVTARVFLASAPVSVRRAEPTPAGPRSLAAAVSVAVGRAPGAFVAAPAVTVAVEPVIVP